MKKSFIILLHAGYWLMYLLLISLFMLFINAGLLRTSNNQNHIIGFLKMMISFTIIPAVIAFYVFYLFLFEKYLSKKKIWALCLAGFVSVLFAGTIGFISLYFISKGIIQVNNILTRQFFIVLFMSVLALIHGTIALVMKGFIAWYADIKIKEELKQKNFETELALVRSQLSPHFLFNTINNIDVLIEKDATKASAYLNRLSDIMRFMLYETKTETIPLQKELEYINKYIELQKIRSSNDHFIQYSLTGEAVDWMIAPMLFIPFIENAFKHSVNKKFGNAIIVRIGIADNGLDFYCENNFGENPLIDQETGGLGNELIKKRLNLLYPSSHKLEIEEVNNIYKVQLTICRNQPTNKF